MLSGRVQAASPGIAVTFDPPSVLSGSPIAGTVSGSGDLREGPLQLILTVAGPFASTDVAFKVTASHGGGCSQSSAGASSIAALILWLRSRRREKA